ncbi:MAG: DUF5060 domain-containing protein [Chthonomonadales bacterium]
MMVLLVWAVAALSTPPAPQLAQAGPLALGSVQPNRAAVPLFGKFELTLGLTATYQNPFDPAQIDVWAVFKSPHGRKMRVNGFLDQPFNRRLVNGREEIIPAGAPIWRVRFAADETGVWTYWVYARDLSGERQVGPRKFRVTPAPDPGFVGVARRNPRVFAFQNGRPFFAVGEDMCWGGPRGSFDYDAWLAKLARAGGNWIRIWMCSWNCGLEWTAEPHGDWRTGDYHGLGVYSLDNAWKLDHILDTAASNHIRVMLCFGTYGELASGGYFNEGQWKANPYNAANGGPCSSPDDFWTNPRARALYRQRLRYIAARYGWRTNIHSWELWNEIAADTPAKVAWHAEMAQFLKGTGPFKGHPADPFHHLLTTSYGSDALWRMPEYDFTQTHHYGVGTTPDHAPVVHADALSFSRFQKPHLMSEFGIDWRKSDRDYDPKGLGVNLHNAIWSAAASGDAGTAMIWYWDNYVDPLDLYREYTALSRFAKRIDWTAGTWNELAFDAPRIERGPFHYTDLVLPTAQEWRKPETTAIPIKPVSSAANVRIPGFLFGPAKPDLKADITLAIHPEHPGKLIVHVDTVSDRSRLRILLDGKVALDHRFSAAPAEPHEYETSELRKEWNIYQARFNRDYSVPFPAGRHVITLQNTEGDWMSISSITLTSYRSSRFPDVNLYGLTRRSEAFFWVQNGAHNWKNVADGRPIPVLTGVTTHLHGLSPGRYVVEWWDTQIGRVISRTRTQTDAAGLPLRLPDLKADLAAVIVPMSAGPARSLSATHMRRKH